MQQHLVAVRTEIAFFIAKRNGNAILSFKMETAQMQASTRRPCTTIYLRDRQRTLELVERAAQFQPPVEVKQGNSPKTSACSHADMDSGCQGSDVDDSHVVCQPCRRTSLNQKQRRLIRALSAADVLAMLLPHLHAQVTQSKLPEDKVGVHKKC